MRGVPAEEEGTWELSGRLGRDQYDLNLCALSACPLELCNFSKINQESIVAVRRRPRFRRVFLPRVGIFERFIRISSLATRSGSSRTTPVIFGRKFPFPRITLTNCPSARPVTE